MKRRMKNIAIMILIILIIGIISPFSAIKVKADGAAISVDGYYDDWSGLPYSWEYNWDNPWQIPNFWDGTKNITKEYKDENGNPYNLDVRHKMSLYSDGQSIYLHIKIASSYDGVFNGDWYQFFVDGYEADFRLCYPGGDSISKNDKKPEGTYHVEVRHANSALSGLVASDAVAVYTKKTNNNNNEVELKIPISTLNQQNPNIKTDHFNMIEFTTPNLMYRKIACSGTSTGPYIGVALCIVVAGGAIFIKRRKKKDILE